MKIDGQCHCGQITFEAETDSNLTNICHCTDCQSFSGSAFRAVVIVQGRDFKLHGSPNTYIKVAEQTGNRSLSAFCGNCASGLYSCAAENPTIYRIRLGAVNQKAQFMPRIQIWTHSALPWVNDLGDVPALSQGHANP